MPVTNTYNSLNPALSVESTKRLHRFVASKFPRRDTAGSRPPFDDRVRDSMLKYVHDPEALIDELKYLDSMEYGCVFENGHILKQIERFQGEHAPSGRWNKNYKSAINIVRKRLKPTMKLKVLEYKSDNDIKDALPREDTHAGFEYILTGLKSKGEYIEGAYDMFEKELTMALESGSFNKPILPGFRLQVSGAYDRGKRTGKKKRKTRLVSMVDFYSILAELMFAKPFQRYVSGLGFYAAGKQPYELHSLVNSNRFKAKNWVSLDYSSFDQTIPSWVIEDSFELIWECFEQNTQTKSLRPLWDIIVNDFIHKKFVGPDGLYEAHAGVPSGSMFTQIIDSIVNLLMITTYFESLNSKSEKKNDFTCLICGDDNLVCSDLLLDTKDIQGYFSRIFGVECNHDKCSQGTRSEDPLFLSRTWRSNGSWREPLELWSKLCFPERFRPYDNNPQLTPEMIIYSYVLIYPLGMHDLMNVDKFMKDNLLKLPNWSDAVLGYQNGYLSYAIRYEKLLA